MASPKLDNGGDRYRKLADEARDHIPAHAPEWHDTQESQQSPPIATGSHPILRLLQRGVRWWRGYWSKQP